MYYAKIYFIALHTMNILEIFFGCCKVNISYIISRRFPANCLLLFLTTHGEISRYSVRCLAVNIPDIWSVVSWLIISVYCWRFRGELSWYFVQRLRTNYLDILPKAHGEYSWYFVGRFTRIILIFCPASSGEISRHFVKRFTENVFDILWPFHGDYLDILSSIFGLIISTLC